MDVDHQGKEEISSLLLNFRGEISQKANNPYAVIQKIQEWTTNQPSLTRILCDLILENSSLLPQGQEEALINQIVQDRIIKNWENNAAAEHLKAVQQSMLDDERNINLLKLYLRIIQKSSIPITDSQDHQKLLEIGLVKEKKGKLKVANPIYANIFNLEWALQKLPNTPKLLSSIEPSLPRDENRSANSTRFWSGIALLVILIVAVAYPLRPRSTPTPSSPPKPQPTSTNPNYLCTSNTNEQNDQEIQFNQLELKKKTGEYFPIECQSKLDELSYRTGMEKAKGDDKGNDFKEGVRRLCQVSEGVSDSFIFARSQLNTWYSNEEYKGIITNYLKVLKEGGRRCPAAKDIPII